ncbi:MAG: retroviral-like aspartic protease, partial [Gammaproteobacteria bacterium]|nr:retroviral-like aspartic protease [Gammaproteobacteria bacterium]
PTQDKQIEANLLTLDEDLAVNIPEFEINSLVVERNRRDLLLEVPCEGRLVDDERMAAIRMCEEDTRQMEFQLCGLAGESEELGEDPANLELYALTKKDRGRETNDPVQALMHAEDVVMDQDSERPDDLPVVLVVIDGEPGDMLVDSGSQINGMSQEFYEKIARGNDSGLRIIPDEVCKIRALGHTFVSKSAVEAVLTIGKNTRVTMKFKILPGLPYAAVVGTPGIRENGFWMTSDLRQLNTQGDFVPCLTQSQLEKVRKCLKERKMVRWQVTCTEDVVVGPREEMTMEVTVDRCDKLGTVMFTPDKAFTP